MSNYRGQTAEYLMRFKLAMAGQKRLALGQITQGGNPETCLAPFATVRKHTFRPNDDTTIEADLYAQAADGPDLVVEVKDWEGKVNKDRVAAFIDAKEQLQPILPADTLFLFYSQQPIAEVNVQRLETAGILYADKAGFSW